jgi:hypothetical protein
MEDMGMDGEYGMEQDMEQEMDKEEYDQELADQVEDDLGYEEFATIVEADEDTDQDNMGDLRG